MFLLNLTLPQFLTLLGTLSAMVVALYLLDRSRRRQTVATLRFWVASDQAAQVRHRRRIQQPLSLILQLLSIALLLLALGQLRWGSRGANTRDHVLILDTSAWMAARSGKGTLMDEARGKARAYIRALPANDRVMLVRADALATPATAFESNRRALEGAISGSQPGATALNLQQALAFARQAQRLQGGRSGEIVFVGAAQIPSDQNEPLEGSFPNLRVLPVTASVENCGIRQVGLHRSGAAPDVWQVLVAVRNYGSTPRNVPMAAAFGGSVVATRRLALPPRSEQNASFEFRTRAAGPLEVRLLADDALPEDNRAVLEVPEQRSLRVVVYSDDPDLLRPVFTTNPAVSAVFRKTAEYAPSAGGADVLVFDRFRPSPVPDADAIWIEPPEQRSPVPVRAVRNHVALERWANDDLLGKGLRAKDVRLDSAEVFEPAPGDIPVAESDAGPVIVARQARHKTIVFGFHPGRTAMKYELTTPLLFANILRWMDPEIFRRWELNAGRVGTVNIPLPADQDTAAVKVLAEDGTPLPYTVQDHMLRFFAGTPGTVRVVQGDREQVYSLTLPEIAESRWEVPKNARQGVPAPAPLRPKYAELWPWLALLAAVCLLAEWILFGRSRTIQPKPVRRMPARKRDLLSFLRKVSL